jgi:hypothetical protein
VAAFAPVWQVIGEVEGEDPPETLESGLHLMPPLVDLPHQAIELPSPHGLSLERLEEGKRLLLHPKAVKDPRLVKGQ